MSDWIPGPWEVALDGQLQGDVDSGPDYVWIGDLHIRPTSPTARLIAAAPEMADLLRLSYPWLEGMQLAASTTDEQVGSDESLEAYEAIRGVCQQVKALLARLDAERGEG